jgi:hypothetical protein
MLVVVPHQERFLLFLLASKVQAHFAMAAHSAGCCRLLQQCTLETLN